MLHADSPHAALAKLRRMDIALPADADSWQIKRAKERYMLARFVATIATSDRLAYPILIQHRERPDFDLLHAAGHLGIECVEAVPEEWAHIDSIREEFFPDVLIPVPRFVPGQRLYSNEQRRQIASGGSNGRVFARPSAIREWADAIAYFIVEKTRKLQQGNYSDFNSVWLLLQDEWRVPLARPEDVLEAAKLCRSLLEPIFRAPGYDAIDVCSYRWHVSLFPGAPRIESVRDLWADRRGR